MSAAIATPPFLQTLRQPQVPWSKWKLAFQAFIEVAVGDSARPALKILLLNALGIEGVHIYTTLQEGRDQAASRAETWDGGMAEDVE